MKARCDFTTDKPLPIVKDLVVKFQPSTITVLTEVCKGCRLCELACPCEVLIESTEFNSHGYHPTLVQHEAQCIGCNACEDVCPDFAIIVQHGPRANPLYVACERDPPR